VPSLPGDNKVLRECVCVREREGESERERVCMCVHERERARERERVCVCGRALRAGTPRDTPKRLHLRGISPLQTKHIFPLQTKHILLLLLYYSRPRVD
jgi:hypothetical protein